MQRLFLDANILFTAAHNPHGKASLVIALAEQGRFQLLSSAYARAEAERNLVRKFPECLNRFQQLVAGIEMVNDRGTGSLESFCPAGLPEKDWPIYRSALMGQVDVLLTGDLRDFGPLMNRPESTNGLLIQTVADFLNSL